LGKIKTNKIVLCCNIFSIIIAEDAQRRWKVLRDRFGRVNRSQKNMPSSAQAGERSWSLFKSLEFLLPHVQHRK